MPKQSQADDARLEETQLNDEATEQEQEEPGEFETAFAEFSGESEEQEEEQAAAPEGGDEEEEPEPAEPKQDKAEEDPWAAVPEELRNQHQKTVQELERAKHAAKSESGRQFALQQKIQELETALKSGAKNNNAPTGEQVREAMRSPEKLAKMKDDFPEVGEAMEEMMGFMRQEFRGELQQRTQKFDQFIGRLQQQQAQNAINSELAKIREAHNDYETTVETPEFQDWVSKQAPKVREQLTSWSSADVIDLLDRYEAAKAPPQVGKPPQQARSQERLRQAATPSGIQRAATRRPGVPDNFEAAFDHYASSS